MGELSGIRTRQRVFDVVAVNGGRVCSTVLVTVTDDEEHHDKDRVVGGSRIAFYEECFGPVVIRERDELLPDSLRSCYGRRGGKPLAVRRAL